MAVAIENMMLAAFALDLGSNWLGLTSAMEGKLKGRFGIPIKVNVLGIVSLGYPAEQPGLRSRFPLTEMTHQNRWGNPWADKAL